MLYFELALAFLCGMLPMSLRLEALRQNLRDLAWDKDWAERDRKTAVDEAALLDSKNDRLVKRIEEIAKENGLLTAQKAAETAAKDRYWGLWQELLEKKQGDGAGPRRAGRRIGL